MEITQDFEGVFRFTNATDEDFKFLWNNKEYNYPAQTCCPMIISQEPLENIQEIRKRAAYKLAVREFYKSETYVSMSKMGQGLPPTYDDKILQPWIDQCLSPLPISKATVREIKTNNESEIKASKAISEKENPNFVFRDESDKAPSVGKMPEVAL